MGTPGLLNMRRPSGRQSSALALCLVALLGCRGAPSQSADDYEVPRHRGISPPVTSPPPAESEPVEERVDDEPAALDDYDEVLSPHGSWVDDTEFGTVWVPHREEVGDDFVPYRTGGRWALADDDQWVWMSDYEWGYVPFHYGRWVWVPSRRGWAWIPGRTYAPAWVVWRVGEPGWDYVGWAPMPPTWCYYNGFATTCRYRPALAFWFVPSVYVFSPHFHHHFVGHHHVHRIARHTHVHRGHHRPAGHRTSSNTRSGHRPSSPSLSEARIPPSAAPAQRISQRQRWERSPEKARADRGRADRGSADRSRGDSGRTDRGRARTRSDRGERPRRDGASDAKRERREQPRRSRTSPIRDRRPEARGREGSRPESRSPRPHRPSRTPSRTPAPSRGNDNRRR